MWKKRKREQWRGEEKINTVLLHPAMSHHVTITTRESELRSRSADRGLKGKGEAQVTVMYPQKQLAFLVRGL